jgi:hypothetical protein
VHFQIVLEEGKSGFVEVPLGEKAKAKGRSIGTKVLREKVWWGVETVPLRCAHAGRRESRC